MECKVINIDVTPELVSSLQSLTISGVSKSFGLYPSEGNQLMEES